MTSPSLGPGNRLNGFTRYACESYVGVCRERQRASASQQCRIRPSNENTRSYNSSCSGIMGAARGIRTEAELDSRPPPLRVESVFFVKHTTSTTSHPYALIVGKMVAVDVDSFPYFRDEHGVSVL